MWTPWSLLSMLNEEVGSVTVLVNTFLNYSFYRLLTRVLLNVAHFVKLLTQAK